MVTVRFKLEKGAILPEYKTLGAAGADVCANLPDGSITIEKGKFCLVPTGLYCEIPSGYEIQVRPRSGLAFKNGITVLNTPGTIDSDYRGELKILLINLGDKDFIINDKERIAQIIVSPVLQAQFEQVTDLSQTQRGTLGFGSTGV